MLSLVAALVASGVLVGVRALGRPSPVVPAAPAACTTWAIVPSPNLEPARFDSDLRAVVAFSETDAWAVGESGLDQEGSPVYPLAEHWDGTSWSIESPPETFGRQGLNAVGGSSGNDVWAVGLGHEALHWDGRSVVPLANPGATDWHVWAISGDAPDDAWAVGDTANGNYSGAPLVEHWDGSKWSVVSTPNPTPQARTSENYSSLSAVDSIGPNDVWATGETGNTAPVGQSNTVALHWDGFSWTRAPTPDVQAQNGTFGHLLGVSGTESGDVWAVGIAGDAPGTMGGGDRALIEHWNGDAWSVSDTMPADSRLLSVTALGPDDAWAVGSTGVAGSYAPLLLRWNGTRWDQWSTNGAGPQPLASLFGISAAPSGELWAVGSQDLDGHSATLTMRCA